VLTVFQTAVIPSFGPFSLAQKERLKTAHPRQEVHFFDHLPIPAELAGFDCIIGNPPVSLIKELPDLKLLQLCSAGVDVYVNDPDYPRQVILANASGAYGEIIAEFTIGMHLYLLKQLGQYRDAMAEGRWEMLGQVSQLAGSTVVCLGTGDLGASYAKKAQLLGAHTIGVKRTPAANLPGFDQVATMDQLEEVLPQATPWSSPSPTPPKRAKSSMPAPSPAARTASWSSISGGGPPSTPRPSARRWTPAKSAPPGWMSPIPSPFPKSTASGNTPTC